MMYAGTSGTTSSTTFVIAASSSGVGPFGGGGPNGARSRIGR